MLALNGVSRVSLGVQTLSSRLQARIGRIQPSALIARSVALLRSAGVTSLNFDLMYGLPGQGDADLDETLRQAVALAPDRFAVFGYAHVPQLIPRQRRIAAHDLPDTRARFLQAELAYGDLTQAGYVPVGFDHFALPKDRLAVAAMDGTLRRNFQGFTEDQADVLLGLGATAISSFPDRLLQNEKNVGRYRALVEGGMLPARRGIHRSETDRRRALVIEQLLTKGRAGAPLLAGLEHATERLAPYLARGLARLDAEGLTIADDGLPYARSIACAFDRYRGLSPAQFSAAV
jgi:oxygen-independent coproporphyrinogen-3 oxidase